jgi:hypothetical protein
MNFVYYSTFWLLYCCDKPAQAHAKQAKPAWLSNLACAGAAKQASRALLMPSNNPMTDAGLDLPLFQLVIKMKNFSRFPRL